MNRIVLIGNGFDLAHGLPTDYESFINSFWKEFAETVFKGKTLFRVETDLVKFEFNASSTGISFFEEHPLILTFDEFNQRMERCKDEYKHYYNHDGGLKLIFNNELFKQINNRIGERKWVDIENEFYRLLKQLSDGERKSYSTPDKLNADLRNIGNRLIAYLSKIQDERIKPELIREQIKKKIYAPFYINDISVGGEDAFFQFISKRLADAADDTNIENLLHKYEYAPIHELSDIKGYINDLKAEGGDENDHHKRHIKLKHNARVPFYFLLPEEILFLNFNYTNTPNLYISKHSGFKVNHIHGELKNGDNPIIFGYGDEMDEGYKKIVNINENEYLENIKSICYLKTDNYRKLLAFIDSAPYQIIIMGHSCGNSDRTLLNTLFEHRNCLSIKPYYHKKEDERDNYIDIVQNISRDFNDMALMRDRVVNKGYCQHLMQD